MVRRGVALHKTLIALLLCCAPYAALHALVWYHGAALLLLLGTFSFEKTRPFAATLVPFVLFLFLYDSLKSFAPHVYHRASVAAFYELEEAIFGVMLPVLLLEVVHPVLDAIGAMFYSVHVPIVLAAAAYLLHRGAREELAVFAWGFLVLNVVANIIQVAFPVAPPWWIIEHGFTQPVDPGVGHAAGLLRADAILGVPHFESIYSQSAYVFGAFPSLHVAFPAWVACNLTGVARYAMIAVTGAMAFFAVYLQHHYVLDVIAGAALALLVYYAVTRAAVRRAVVTLDAKLAGEPR